MYSTLANWDGSQDGSSAPSRRQSGSPPAEQTKGKEKASMNAIKNMNTLHAIEPATTSRANVDELAAKEAQAAPRRSPAFSETQTRAAGVLSTSASSSQPERPPPHPMTPSERSLPPSTSASGYLASSLTLTASFIPRSASLNFPGPPIVTSSSAAAARVAAGSGPGGPQNASAVGLLLCLSVCQPVNVGIDDVFELRRLRRVPILPLPLSRSRRISREWTQMRFWREEHALSWWTRRDSRIPL